MNLYNRNKSIKSTYMASVVRRVSGDPMRPRCHTISVLAIHVKLPYLERMTWEHCSTSTPHWYHHFINASLYNIYMSLEESLG